MAVKLTNDRNRLLIISDQEALKNQPELHFRVSNMELEFCETVNVLGASGSVGAFSASVKSTSEFLCV